MHHNPCLLQPLLCPEIHGDSGLDGPQGKPLLDGTVAAPAQRYARAVPRMYERIATHYAERSVRCHDHEVAAEAKCTCGRLTLTQSDDAQQSLCSIRRREKVQLVATGALTNVALLLILYPEVGRMIDITLMGGALGIGEAPDVPKQPRVCVAHLSGGDIRLLLHRNPSIPLQATLAQCKSLTSRCSRGHKLPVHQQLLVLNTD